MTKIPPFEVEYDGKTYQGEFARCTSFTLEYEDHGIFTAMVDFSGPSWGQGLPNMALGSQPDAAEFSMAYLIGLVDALGTPMPTMDVAVAVFRPKDADGKTGILIEGFARVLHDGTLAEPFLVSRIRDKTGVSA